MEAKNRRHTRPTIGILAGWSTLEGSTPDHYRALVMQGIQSAARSWDCNLLLSWGIRRITDIHKIYPSWPVVSSESDFIPVGPWNTDGLIVFTPLASDERSNYLQALQAEGFPVLFIGTGEQGPQIAANNGIGIQQAIAHLAEHGHRRIAFIAGSPLDNGDSQVRLDAYHTAVAEYQLEADPRLVAWGWHDSTIGREALQSLLAADVKFTAVLASNDNSAIGAMQAIHAADFNIPGDVAVMGFDNQSSALAQVPPLSSVHVPLKLIGEQALMMMAHHLIDGTPLDSMQISTRIVQRQSCGCVPEVVSSAINGALPATLANHHYESIRECQLLLVKEMLSVLPAVVRVADGNKIQHFCTILVDAFFRSLSAMNSTYFQRTFINCIHELEKDDKSLDPWQEMISVLRREMTILPVDWNNHEINHLAENLLHQARTVIGESTQRQDYRHQYQRTLNALALNALTAYLSAALSESEVVEILNKHLASVGIRNAKIMLFEANGDDPVARSSVLTPGADAAVPAFATREFPSPTLYPPDELLNIVLLPLVFQSEVLGYAAFDATDDLGACAVIAIQLAATIKVARLHAQVVELSLTDALTGLYNRRYFELFLKNEINRSKRFLRGLGLILVDCDNFKEYNDTYGHPAGDEVLQAVAKSLLLVRQRTDMVARLGGDEFVIILPETRLPGALDVGRKIQTAINQLSNLKRPVSVSIGLVEMNSENMNAEALIQQADLALYESKRRGKNHISFFSKDNIFDEKQFLLLK